MVDREEKKKMELFDSLKNGGVIEIAKKPTAWNSTMGKYPFNEYSASSVWPKVFEVTGARLSKFGIRVFQTKGGYGWDFDDAYRVGLKKLS